MTSRRHRHTLATCKPFPRVWRSPGERPGGVRGPQPTRIKGLAPPHTRCGTGSSARDDIFFFLRRKFSAPPPGSRRERVVSFLSLECEEPMSTCLEDLGWLTLPRHRLGCAGRFLSRALGSFQGPCLWCSSPFVFSALEDRVLVKWEGKKT